MLFGAGFSVVRFPACFPTISGSLQELAIAGASGSEDDVLTLLQAVPQLKQLKLLDIKGVAVSSQVLETPQPAIAITCTGTTAVQP
jgi:hypothetical protein